ncbi:MAG: hypothetical protein ACP5F9_05975 [Thiomonas sp.]
MRLSFKPLIAALALAVPGLALAAQPLAVRVDGHDMPMSETVQTVHTAAGPAQIRTWTWQSPHGHARVVIQQTEGQLPPALALQQLRAVEMPLLQAQQAMARMTALMNAQLQAAFGPLSTLPVMLPQPLWAPQSVLPATVIIVPAPALPTQHPTPPHPATPGLQV